MPYKTYTHYYKHTVSVLHHLLVCLLYDPHLRIVSAACRLRWALLLARIPLHHAWMAIAARCMVNKYKSVYKKIGVL